MKNLNGKLNPNYREGKYVGNKKCKDCNKGITVLAIRCNHCDNIFRSKSSLYRFKLGNANRGKKFSYNIRKKMSIASKKKWNNSEYREKQVFSILKGSEILPNKPEKIITNLLSELFPQEYKYVGNGEVIINGFNPDFINVNGQKKIIEFFGDYWHNLNSRVKNDKERLRTYKLYGYKTLVIWEHELKNIDKVKDKIINFNIQVRKSES